MLWASAISEKVATDAALNDAASQLRERLGVDPDLVVAFVSPHHAAAHRELPARLALSFPRALVVGCGASGVIGAGHEVEERPALSLTAASLPGVRLTPLHLDHAELEGLDAGTLRARLELPVERDPQLVVLTDPFTMDADALVALLDEAYPKGRKIGGLASGGRFPGSNVLFLGREGFRSGAVCVALSGDIAVDTIVAQGCRPIGRPMVVTRGHDNVIDELDRRRPTDVLRELFDSLDERDRSLFRHALHVGLELDAGAVEVKRGEVLVRNVLGMEPKDGALAVGARVRPWQVVQFLLRDAQTAAEDLTGLLDRYRAGGAQPAGALLFSCLGRGMHLYGRPDHDTGLFQDRLGPIPLGGFFCNGEIGPVGGTTFLHGYTSAFGLFRPRAH